MSTQSPSAILRKLKKPHDTDKDDSSKKTDTDKHDEKTSDKGGKRSALIDFIAKCKKTNA